MGRCRLISFLSPQEKMSTTLKKRKKPSGPFVKCLKNQGHKLLDHGPHKGSKGGLLI
jgi:hypothetical protein